MTTLKEKLINIMNFLGAIITSSLFQVFMLGVSGALYFIILLFSGGLMSHSTEKGLLLSNLPLILGSVVIALIYGAVWLVFWTGLYNNGIKWFYYRVAASIIPLLILIYWLYSIRDPYEILTIPMKNIFNCLVTGVILLPIYSISIYKFILHKSENKVRNRILVYTASLLLGVLIYALSWNMMFKVGSVNLENESLAGIKLMQLADKKALEKKFGEFKYSVDDGKGKIGFGFNNAMRFLSVEVDSNNQVTDISVANSPHIGNIELTTSKNIGPGSSLYDVLKAYGNNCYMESERDPMGDGWDYVIYVDRENNIILEFDFSVFGGIPDSQEGLVESIVLKKGWSGARN